MTIFRPNCARRSAWAPHRPPPPTLPRPTTPLRLRWRPITENHRRPRPLLPLRRRRRAAGPPPRRLRDWTKMAPPPTQNRRWKPRTRFSKTGVKIVGNFLMNRCHRPRIHFVAFVDNCGVVVLTGSMTTTISGCISSYITMKPLCVTPATCFGMVRNRRRLWLIR